ncbi:MAG: hypothetical protein JSV16_03735 [Candidatus Hydrogenedentota bacterium]|nr:MAG: hypothetical protein JSV16_03735 [Candidatus Hydrogenedentota bacterium]
MRSKANILFAVILACAVVVGCARQSYRLPASPAMPSQVDTREAPVQPADFETPPVLSAQEYLPPELQRSAHHWLEDEVYTYGFMNNYRIISPYEEFDVTSDDMLRIRVQEIYAIAALEEVSKSGEFGNAVKTAAKSPIEGAKNLILHPVDTISGIPKGAWRFVTRVGEMTKGGRGEFEESVSKELIGFSAVKRQYAYALGVDVYSSNQVLQRYLNSVSWASYAGGMPVKVGMIFIPGPVGIIVNAPKATLALNQILRDSAPEDLRRMNRKLLRDAGIDKKLVEEFLKHPWYSPKHTTYLVDALVDMENARGKEVFLRLALNAASEEDALLFERIAEMMRGYNNGVSPVKQIVYLEGLPAFYAENGSFVVPLMLDYGVWTEEGAEAVGIISRATFPGLKIVKREVWISGNLSPLARQMATARGISVYGNAFAKLYPQPEE